MESERARSIAAVMPELAREALLWLWWQPDGVAVGAPYEYAATLRHSKALHQCVERTSNLDNAGHQRICTYRITDVGVKVAELINPDQRDVVGGGVYFIQGATTGLIKIGYAGAVAHRLFNLQCGSPDLLHLLAIERAPQSREAELHLQFAPWRLHGEWFAPAETLIQYIAALDTAEKAAA